MEKIHLSIQIDQADLWLWLIVITNPLWTEEKPPDDQSYWEALEPAENTADELKEAEVRKLAEDRDTIEPWQAKWREVTATWFEKWYAFRRDENSPLLGALWRTSSRYGEEVRRLLSYRPDKYALGFV